jgi:outer membrane receptor protein involved in Fe transport
VQSEKWSLSFDYSYTDATYRDALVLNSPENPFADANGQIAVVPGDRLPNVPANMFKATLNYEPTPDWRLNLAVRAASGSYLQGDAANLNAKTGSYAVLDIGAGYQVTESIELFATVENVFDANYATFGTFSPVSAVPMAEAPGATNPRSLAPAPPRTFGGGLRVRF